jgi:hypothetical protein
MGLAHGKRAQNMLLQFSPHRARRSSLPRASFWVVLAFLSISVALTGPAIAEEEAEGSFLQLETVIVDLRTGDADVRGPSQSAFAEGLGVHGEIHLSGDKELQSILGRQPYAAAFERGKDHNVEDTVLLRRYIE